MYIKCMLNIQKDLHTKISKNIFKKLILKKPTKFLRNINSLRGFNIHSSSGLKISKN